MYKEKLLNFEFCSGNRKFVPEFICKIWRWFASCKAKKIYVILYVTVSSNVTNRIGGVMVSVLTSSVVDHGFEPQSF